MTEVIRLKRDQLEKVFTEFETLQQFELLIETLDQINTVTLIGLREDIDTNTVDIGNNDTDITNLQTLKADLASPSFTGGIGVTGIITVTGTVDGRDVSADGSKLDTIESGATGDQTAGEIKGLYESNADTNAFTDADESKLDGIEANATTDQTGAEIKALYEAEANTNAFTDADETKLDNIEANAQVNTVDSVAGKTGVVTLVKADVGLGNVDNTSDLNKPISTATQAALDDKATSKLEFNRDTQTPTTGFSISITNDDVNQWLVLDPAAGLASGTVTFVASGTARDGQEIIISTTEQITSLTLAGNGGTIYGAVSLLAADSSVKYKFDSSLTAWFKVD